MSSAQHPSQFVLSAERRLTLKQRARWMRRNPTASEQRLWLVLSGSKLGVPFRRHVVVGDFIVDFAAPRVKLIVEVDGGYHGSRIQLDAARQRKLEREGYRVLRFTDAEMMQELQRVVTCIWRAVQA